MLKAVCLAMGIIIMVTAMAGMAMANTVMANTVMANMADMDMDKRQGGRKIHKGKIIAAVGTILAVLNLFVLLLWPELPAKFFGISDEVHHEISEKDGKGNGKAALTLTETERTFDGNGIFEAMDGVQALDNDGDDITGKVAVAYISGKTIQEKEIWYTVYDSELDKLEAVCQLRLENYQGPSILFDEIGTVSWEKLQRLTEVLVGRGVMKGDDGFGNDVSSGITYFYEINPDGKSAEVTFSLTNVFQDYRNEKVILNVDGIPVEGE